MVMYGLSTQNLTLSVFGV